MVLGFIGTVISLQLFRSTSSSIPQRFSLLRTQGWLLSLSFYVAVSLLVRGWHRKFADVEQQILGSTLVQPLVKPD